MKRLMFSTVVFMPVLLLARTVQAEPAWGVNCLSCHGEMQMDVLVVIGEDTMADPDETNTGAPDRGILRPSKRTAGQPRPCKPRWWGSAPAIGTPWS